MPALADLRFAAQSLADRVNSGTITTPEWNIWINDGAQELYGILTSAYADYAVKQFPFTLAGTAAGNTLWLGIAQPPATWNGMPQVNAQVCPDFFLLRGVWRQVMSQGGSPYYATLPRLNSYFERNLHIGPSINPLYGQMAAYYNIMGNALEVLPPDSAAATYLLTYVPKMPLLVNDTDTIDQYWLSVNGWDQYIRKYVAAEALTKEESLETASYLRAQLATLRERILRECKPRDDSQPEKITDVKRVRANYGFGSGSGGWGSPGF
jgi:hypothetical protein